MEKVYSIHTTLLKNWSTNIFLELLLVDQSRVFIPYQVIKLYQWTLPSLLTFIKKRLQKVKPISVAMYPLADREGSWKSGSGIISTSRSFRIFTELETLALWDPEGYQSSHVYRFSYLYLPLLASSALESRDVSFEALYFHAPDKSTFQERRTFKKKYTRLNIFCILLYPNSQWCSLSPSPQKTTVAGLALQRPQYSCSAWRWESNPSPTFLFFGKSSGALGYRLPISVYLNAYLLSLEGSDGKMVGIYVPLSCLHTILPANNLHIVTVLPIIHIKTFISNTVCFRLKHILRTFIATEMPAVN